MALLANLVEQSRAYWTTTQSSRSRVNSIVLRVLSLLMVDSVVRFVGKVVIVESVVMYLVDWIVLASDGNTTKTNQ